MAASKEGSSDLIHLGGPLTLEAILGKLHQNFMEGQCYTWIGPILLCVNMYENPSPSMMGTLLQLVNNVSEELFNSQRPHTVVFSGKSGSGKTFTADRLMVKMLARSTKSEWILDIRKYWQVSCVVLKALGSAGTSTNKDSSRFGRMIEFCYSGTKIIRLRVNAFFLDQTRLVQPNQDEQNFHIFYQILAGLTTEERSRFHFPHHDSRSLHYLSQATDPPDSVQMLQSHFEAWKSSLAQLGIPLNDVLKVLIAVLLLGNILFYEAKNQELSFQGIDEMRAISNLLCIPPTSLQKGLTVRTYISKHGIMHSSCSAAAANSARDTLAKALYMRTVVAVIRRINSLLKGAGQPSPTKPNGKSTKPEPRPTFVEHTINVLDLFGYEANATNSLEQLCVNWTSEKLQYFYAQTVFTDTLRECQTEGVDPLFESTVHDCGPTIELIGNHNSGLLREINQETLSPRVSSEDIRVRMRHKFDSFDCFVPPSGSASSFTIKHYCGEVSYDTYSILNANADSIADDIVAVFSSKNCKFGFVTHLFAAEVTKNLHMDGSPKGQMCRLTPSFIQHASHAETRTPSAFVQDFQSRIEDVVTVLKKSKPFFVRCIKSNSSQAPGRFDRETVSQQIKEMTIFETVDLIQGGYFNNLRYQDFVRRYQVVAPGALERMRSKPREMTEDLLAAFVKKLEGEEVTEDMWALGHTKVFLTEELRQHLERLRAAVRNSAAIKIQSAVKMLLVQRNLKRSLAENKLHSHPQQALSSSSPPIPDRQRNGDPSYNTRNYTIVGNYKVAFPQWRLMRRSYPGDETGHGIIQQGEEVYVLSRSQKRGYLVVEYHGRQIHLPHYYTELPILNPPVPRHGGPSLGHAGPPVGHATVSPPLPRTTYSEL